MKTPAWIAAVVVVLSGCASMGSPPMQRASGLQLADIDAQVRPQDDLYRYMNGHWLATTDIPPDRAFYARYIGLRDSTEEQLRRIIEEAAAKTGKAMDSDEQKVGDLYASYMNEAKLEELGLKPLEKEFAAIEAIAHKRDLARVFAHFARIGAPSPVFYGIVQDPKEATQYIASVGQAAPYYGTPSGLGLPDRDYYLSDEPKFKTLRAQYVAHVERMLRMAGVTGAAQAARDILQLETGMARIQWTRVDDRDDEKVYNKYQFSKLANVTPDFDWGAYLAEVGAEKSPGLIVRQPSYFQGLARLMKQNSLSVWRLYLKFHLLSSAAPLLSKNFVDEHFYFHGKTLAGAPEIRPRWKRAVQAEGDALGEVLGRIYVERHFPPEAKARVEVLVANLTKAYEQSIRDLDWMSAETKVKALEKLSRFSLKIGYPSRWKDYSMLRIEPDDLYGNMARSTEVEFQRERRKLGAPIDREEWGMTPQTVNAYYNVGLNEIVFPAAFLQPPFFDRAADDAMNYGAIGAVIGHEIGHGFDDQGSKYDGNGNLKSWWTEQDRKAFEERTRLLIAQYDAYCPLQDQCVSGALTVGENIGDLGGLSIAYKAYGLALGGQPAPVIDGFTGDQRFFLGWAQAWAAKYREPELLRRLKTDPHSPSEYRANGTVVNVPVFYPAFGITPHDKMYLAPEKRVKIW